MNLIIDIGNTRTKLSVFNRGEVLITVPVDAFTTEDVALLQKEYPTLNKAILSSVKRLPSGLKKELKKYFETFIELDDQTPLPIQNGYGSKKTLGRDRLAAVVGAYDLLPGANVLVIDAGTAITFDILTEQGEYLGGNISPGLEMRFKALHQFTDQLPLVTLQKTNGLYGKTTEEAIRLGVQHGVIYETEKTIEAFNEFYNNLKIIITGGDANFFDLKLKNSFFVHFNLTALGLNCILEYNG